MADQPQASFIGQEEKEFERFYKLSQFWIHWRQTFKRVGFGLLVAFDLLLVVIIGRAYIDFGVFNYFNDRAMIASITNGLDHFHALSTADAASSLHIGTTRIFAVDSARTDFYTDVTNANKDWEATFTYDFVYGNSKTVSRQGFVLPGQASKPIAELAVATPSTPSSAQFEITALNWVRVNHHAITDYATWQNEHLNFTVTNVTYTPNLALTSGVVGRTTFTLINNSAFAFWNPTFTIVLLRNNTPVGVTTTTPSAVGAGESREVSVNWFGTAPQANATLIVPNIDIFDPEVYMPLHGEIQPDVRQRISVKK